MTELVKEVMTEDPLTVEADDTVELARSLMTSCRMRHLPVSSGDLLRGILSIRDLTRAAGTQRVREVMHSPVETLAPEDTIVVAAERLLNRSFSSLPVIDRGRIVGILTTTDLVRIACEKLADTPVTALMTRPTSEEAFRCAAIVLPSARAAEAGRLLVRDRLDALRVVDAGCLLGVVSAFDYLRLLLDRA